MKVSLVVQTPGKASGQAISVASAQFIIGRDPQCNLRPASAMISKRHCAVLMKDDRVFLRDFDSTNGTFLNDQPVKGEVALKDGDILKVGPLLFKVAIEGALAPVPAAAPTKTTPMPPPKKSNIMDDDAAAMLLDLGDESPANPSIPATETADAVPEGTTIMEMPILQAALDKAAKEKEAKDKEAKDKAAEPPEEKRPAAKTEDRDKKKNQTGLAQDAAKAILEKLRAGGRKKA